MDNETLLRIIDLKIEINKYEEGDVERKKIIESGSYAIAEGYRTANMRIVADLEAQLNELLK